jgi:pentose-5-phosphate-3-epimerase
MRISASVSSLHARDLAPSVGLLDKAGVNFYHLDSIESREIFDFAKRLRGLTKTPFDLHLITSDPIKYWDDIRESSISEITIQLESLHSPLYVPADLKSKVGIAVLASRPAEFFKPFEKSATTLLLMTTTPGHSGGKFQQEQFANIMRYRILYPHLPITVDGGVIPTVSSVLTMMGIPQIVSGSYLFKGDSIAETVSNLRQQDLSDWRMDEVLLPEPELLKRFSLRFSEDALFMNKNAELSRIPVKNDWLDILAAKTISGSDSPFPLIWVDETIPLQDFQNAINKLDTPPHMAITLNSDGDLTGICCLAAYKG